MNELFINSYEKIVDIDNYAWNIQKEYFKSNISDSITTNNSKKFQLTILQFIYYLNFLSFKNILTPELNQFLYTLFVQKDVITFCVTHNMHDLLHPFLKSFILKNSKVENYDKYIKLIMRIEEINSIKPTLHKKILNTIIYRDLYSVTLGYKNFNEYYFHNIETEYDLESFIQVIPKYTKIIDINCTVTPVTTISIIKIIKQVFNDKEYAIKNIETTITVSCIQSSGKIIFIKDNIDDIIQTQYDLDMLLHHNKQFKESYLKKQNNIIYIKYKTTEIKDDLMLLELLQKIIMAKTKLLYFPRTVSETVYYISTLYQKDIFQQFIILSKNKSFIIQLIKFFYIYSYYDYFFYYNTKLLSLLKQSSEKSKIFMEFCDQASILFKFPKGMLAYPPFCDNDSIISYDFQSPNYIKLYHLLSAIEPKHTNNIEKIINLFLHIKNSKKIVTKQQNKINIVKKEEMHIVYEEEANNENFIFNTVNED